MIEPVSDSSLDAILALQLTLAWAGGRCSPRCLGWWNTDLVDESGGGDLWACLPPQTHASAGLEDGALEPRLRTPPGVTFRRMGALVEMEWGASSLSAWAEPNL